MAASGAGARAEAWGVPAAPERRGRCTLEVSLAVLVPTVAFAGLGVAFWGVPGLASGLAVLGVSLLVIRTAGSGLARELDPRAAVPERLHNLVAGLSADLGSAAPPTFIVNGDGINALVFAWRGAPALGVTEAAARDLARTELEAVVAHCLVRLARASAGRRELALGGIFAACAPRVDELVDARAVAVTRYPPALAKAIEKATPATGRFAHLWFVGAGPQHAPVARRVAALGEL